MASLRRAKTSLFSSLLGNFLKPKLNSPLPSPFPSRLFASSTPSYGDNNNNKRNHASDGLGPVSVSAEQRAPEMDNPFQLKGPGDLLCVDEMEEGLLVRVALPGVGEDRMKVWAQDNSVFFAGSGEVECEKEDCGRTYGGSLEFNPAEHRVADFKSEMRHGILRLLIPATSKVYKKKTKTDKTGRKL